MWRKRIEEVLIWGFEARCGGWGPMMNVGGGWFLEKFRQRAIDKMQKVWYFIKQ